MPVRGPVQRRHLRIDGALSVQGAIDAMLEEQLGRATCRDQRIVVARRVVVGSQPDRGRPTLMERRPIARRSPVAVPPAVGPLPFEQLRDELLRARVLRVPEAAGRVDRVALHRGIGTIEPIDLRDRVEVARIRDPRQLTVDRRVERGADGVRVDRQREVGQRDQAPVDAPPLAVRVDPGFGKVEQRRDDRPVRDRRPVPSDRDLALGSVQQPGPRAVADSRLVRREKPVDDAVHSRRSRPTWPR